TALASTGIVVSTLATSFFVHAMREQRHFIMLLPALLMLSAEGATWLRNRTHLAIPSVLLAVATFPFSFYAQRPGGFAELAHKIALPARMLISSDASGEGAWIAEVALNEKRPTSVIVRGTKALSSSDWNGGGYKLLASTPAEVDRRLDELALDILIVD